MSTTLPNILQDHERLIGVATNCHEIVSYFMWDDGFIVVAVSQIGAAKPCGSADLSPNPESRPHRNTRIVLSIRKSLS